MWFPKQRAKQQGIALVTAMLMLLLLSSLAVGFALLVTSEQRSNGLDLDHTQTFYAAYGAMEQLNAQMGILFSTNFQNVSATDITNLTKVPPSLPGINFFDPVTGGSGYAISPFQVDASGNPKPYTGPINSGPYQGFQGLITDYNITISAQSSNFSLTTGTTGSGTINQYGSEIRLRRHIQTVAIPVFQFGIFSQTDLSYFPGPNFNFGGRVATNGDLYLGSKANLVLSDKISAYGDIITDQLSNGLGPSTSPTFVSQYGGNVYATVSPNGPFTGTPPPAVVPTAGATYRQLQNTEGSINAPSGGCVAATGKPVNAGVTTNSNWTTISLTDYNANVIDGAFGCPRGTGAKNLTLPILSKAAVAQGATAISLIKEPVNGEIPDPPTGQIFQYRYFSYPISTGYAMLRILLADTPGEITSLPTVTSSPAPMALFCTPGPLSSCAAAQGLSGSGITGGPTSPSTLPPWAASSGTAVSNTIGSQTASPGAGTGDWYKAHYPRLGGYIKIEYADASSSGSTGPNPSSIVWKDVTAEILSLGTTGRNLTKLSGGKGQWLTPSGSANPGNPISGTGNGNGTVGSCYEPYPNAILRMQRLVEVPNAGGCGYANPPGANGPSTFSNLDSDYVPMMLFDAREGVLRDTQPAGYSGAKCTPTYCLTLAGTMYYVELDVTNLARWFAGKIGNWSSRTVPSTSSSPPLAGFLVYFSDRRSNQPCSMTLGSCPNSTPQKLGNLGFEDFVNLSSATGQPNGVLDQGEDLNGANATLPGQPPVSMPQDLYGNYPSFFPVNTSSPYAPATSPTNLQSASVYGQNLINPAAATRLYTASPTLVTLSEARDNPAMFFRRALKLTDAQAYNLGNCGTNVPCGLTIASENPVYVEGNYNATGTCSGSPCSPTFTGTDYPSAIVADAVTLLSTNWNDLNSYLSPYDASSASSRKSSAVTYYRMAVLSGKGLSFKLYPMPTYSPTPPVDFGTDGGVHNFMRFLEYWNGTLAYSGSIANFYYNTQAIGLYKCCTTVYGAPNRGYSFNTNYLTPTLLPPRTPAFTDINTLGFTQLLMPTQQ